MSTINGIGTRLAGFTFRRPDGSHGATLWFTIMYMPIVPIRRLEVVLGDTQSSVKTSWTTTETTIKSEYLILGRRRLNVGEVLLTYLMYWLIVPGLAAGPLVLIRESGALVLTLEWIWFFLIVFGAPVFSRWGKLMPPFGG